MESRIQVLFRLACLNPIRSEPVVGPRRGSVRPHPESPLSNRTDAQTIRILRIYLLSLSRPRREACDSIRPTEFLFLHKFLSSDPIYIDLLTARFRTAYIYESDPVESWISNRPIVPSDPVESESRLGLLSQIFFESNRSSDRPV